MVQAAESVGSSLSSECKDSDSGVGEKFDVLHHHVFVQHGRGRMATAELQNFRN